MSDWTLFLDRTPWFLQAGATAEVGEPRPWGRGPVAGLPTMSALLAAATVTPLAVGDRGYELLTWGPADERRGWLCDPPHEPDGAAVHPRHADLWRVCGGFTEHFGGPDTWWDNQDQVLTAAATRFAVGEAIDAYAWIWAGDGLEVPIDPAEWYPAAIEASGNLTLVHRTDGRLLLFAPDHSFDDVTPYAGSPDLSLLTLDRAPDLVTWTETCAAAWLDR